MNEDTREYFKGEINCPDCHGSGIRSGSRRCITCSGRGLVWHEYEVSWSSPVCARCGEPISRDFSGWSHKILRPMSVTERRKYRHKVIPRSAA